MDNKLNQIKQILTDADPVKLIKIGAPQDEYDSEAVDIYERINRYHSVDQIQQTIYNVFVQSFNDEGGNRSIQSIQKLIGNFDSYTEIAQKIKEVVGY